MSLFREKTGCTICRQEFLLLGQDVTENNRTIFQHQHPSRSRRSPTFLASTSFASITCLCHLACVKKKLPDRYTLLRNFTGFLLKRNPSQSWQLQLAVDLTEWLCRRRHLSTGALAATWQALHWQEVPHSRAPPPPILIPGFSHRYSFSPTFLHVC